MEIDLGQHSPLDEFVIQYCAMSQTDSSSTKFLKIEPGGVHGEFEWVEFK